MPKWRRTAISSFVTVNVENNVKKLRENPTKAETEFMEILSELEIPYHFQYPALSGKGVSSGKWRILDFYLPDHGYYIEIDGIHHRDKKQRKSDIGRRCALSAGGFMKELRFTNREVLEEGDMVRAEMLHRFPPKRKKNMRPIVTLPKMVKEAE